MNLEFRFEASALRKQTFGSIERIVNVHIRVVAANTFGEILGALSSLRTALLLHAHVNSMEDLVAEFFGGVGKIL